ncbi:hypothetical protein ATCVNEJV3_529L [Acanthocystis turfacea Chlorella virus NE-JV-3]|nr:hypothetical protein ATCVNEJV3_529L [Acanthocystis turfacea Chlorella virus NE-JV-3]
MATLEYYFESGEHIVFEEYTIDENSAIRNASGHVMTRVKDGDYYRVCVRHKGKPHNIRVGRAMASTFIGKPPTLRHTADHEDKNSLNDTLENIRWLCNPGQRKNQDRSEDLKSAFIIVKDEVELTAKEWVKVYKKPNGKQYTTKTIREYAQQQIHGFKYKVFPDLPEEEWKAVEGSKNKTGEWFVSNMSRMKYKTKHAENVMGVDRLGLDKGYPVVNINGKDMRCHVLCMMTFRPEEYIVKRSEFIILHESDDKLDFSPSKLRWGAHPENGKDAHRNGKHNGTKTAQKPVASYVNGEFEREHESLSDAAKYLQENGYSDANHPGVSRAAENGIAKYDRTWKYV